MTKVEETDGVTAILILGLALVAQAAPVTVSELLADPERFNGQPVIACVAC